MEFQPKKGQGGGRRGKHGIQKREGKVQETGHRRIGLEGRTQIKNKHSACQQSAKDWKQNHNLAIKQNGVMATTRDKRGVQLEWLQMGT